MEDAYYDVEKILDQRKHPVTGQLEYLIKWEGYAEKTWEPEANLETIPHMLREFQQKHKKEQRLKKQQKQQKSHHMRD